jgi:hypothetical protein
MLTPENLQNIPQSFVDLFQELETFIIQDISRRLKKAGKITSTAEWQLQRAKLYNVKNIEQKIAEILKKSNINIDSVFNEAAATSLAQENEIYKTAGYKTIGLKESKALLNYVSAAIKNTKGDIENITQSLGFAEMQNGHVIYNDIAKFYQKELNLANFKVISGASDYSSAIKQAIRKIAESGVRYINYDNGYSVNVDTAVRRAVLTSVQQMNQDMTNHVMDELLPANEQYAEVTAHANARPSHQVWQGRVFKVNGSDKDYPNLAEATGLGSATGLLGIHCRHSYYAFIKDVSVRAYTDEQLKNINTPDFKYKGKSYDGYEATQYQRALENEIRKEKRDLLMYNETGLTDDAKASKSRINQLRKEYKDFSETSGISQKKNRITI